MLKQIRVWKEKKNLKWVKEYQYILKKRVMRFEVDLRFFFFGLE